MVALVALLLILAVFGGLGFAAHFLWHCCCGWSDSWSVAPRRVSAGGGGTAAGSARSLRRRPKEADEGVVRRRWPAAPVLPVDRLSGADSLS
jgi:hypothetical protein